MGKSQSLQTPHGWIASLKALALIQQEPGRQFLQDWIRQLK
jgi:hypothetical protein